MIELNMAKFNVKNPQTGEFEPLDGASQAKVQSDWNQTDNSAEDFIKNKPNLGTAARKNVDQVPTLSSTNLVESNGVAAALSTKADLVDGKIPASEYDTVMYIAGSNISIDPANSVDLFEYAWSNVAPTDTTTWQTIADSKSLTSAVIDLENITKFKLQAVTKQAHTTFISGAYVDSNNVLYRFPSSSLDSDGQIKQNSEIDVPLGYTGIRFVARLDNPRYQQGSEVHESDFDYIRIEIIEGTHSKAAGDQTNKIISAADQMQSDWDQGDNTSPDYIKNKPTIPAAQVPSDWMATQGVSRIINKPTLGSAATKNYKTTVTSGSNDLVTSDAVYSAISTKADLVDGKVPMSQMPPAVIERMVSVSDDNARFQLTKSQVQNGDTVKVLSTNKMYLVVDDDYLDTEAGYSVYVAGRAAEAVADQNGNTINTTYATITALATKVDNTDFNLLSADVDKLMVIKDIEDQSYNLVSVGKINVSGSHYIVIKRTDGAISVSADGSQSGSTDNITIHADGIYPAGTYNLTGCTGGSSSTYYMTLYKVTNEGGTDVYTRIDTSFNNEKTITLTEDSQISFSIVAAGGTVLTNQIFRPMLTPVELSGEDFSKNANTTEVIVGSGNKNLDIVFGDKANYSCQVFVTGAQGQLNGYIILNAAPSWALTSKVLYPTETLTCNPNNNYAITKTAVDMSTLLTTTWIGGKVLRLTLASGIAQDKDIHVIALGY